MEQIPDPIVIVNRHMQVDACDGDVRVPGSHPDLSKRASTGECVAYKSVPPVMNGQRPQAGQAQDLTRGQEAAADGRPL
jgi:hypothetical protein